MPRELSASLRFRGGRWSLDGLQVEWRRWFASREVFFQPCNCQRSFCPFRDEPGTVARIVFEIVGGEPSEVIGHRNLDRRDFRSPLPQFSGDSPVHHPVKRQRPFIRRFEKFQIRVRFVVSQPNLRAPESGRKIHVGQIFSRDRFGRFPCHGRVPFGAVGNGKRNNFPALSNWPEIIPPCQWTTKPVRLDIFLASRRALPALPPKFGKAQIETRLILRRLPVAHALTEQPSILPERFFQSTDRVASLRFTSARLSVFSFIFSAPFLTRFRTPVFLSGLHAIDG